MSIVFYKEIGFSKGQIAIYSKGAWLDYNCCFHIIRWCNGNESRNNKNNVLCWRIDGSNKPSICGFGLDRKSELLFAIAVIADDITAAFATVAFVAFISLLVDRTYTATQYALLASIGTAGRTTLASSSGLLWIG
ncbi:MAG: hypothetical protein CM1200mP13_01490 [Candidatus Pelagibacterales bacterium]|nr:MAG: hypothetical protein CM1200mP13_01490 [Pelagibacterales bacterium]